MNFVASPNAARKLQKILSLKSRVETMESIENFTVENELTPLESDEPELESDNDVVECEQDHGGNANRRE